MIFPGWGFATVEASGIGPGDERLQLITPDGVELVGALRRARGPSRGLLLVFGGNAEDADWRLRHFDGWLRDVDIVTFFYRGFGPERRRARARRRWSQTPCSSTTAWSSGCIRPRVAARASAWDRASPPSSRVAGRSPA